MPLMYPWKIIAVVLAAASLFYLWVVLQKPVYQDDIGRAKDAQYIPPLRLRAQQNPHDADAHYALSLRLVVSMNACGNIPEAITECRAALALDPSNAKYKSWMNTLRFQQNECKNYNKAVSKQPVTGPPK